MGKSLIIKGADFSQNAIVLEEIVVFIEQGIISLLTTGAKGRYGNQGSSEPNWNKRMRAPKTNLIYIEAGQEYTITGLQGNGTVPALRLDAAIYSSAENPDYPTCLHTLNGDTSNYYKFNTEGNDSYNFTAPYTGYYAFCFAGPNLTEEVSPTNYNLLLILITQDND